MKTLAIGAVALVVLMFAGKESLVSGGVHTVTHGIAKLVPTHAQGDDQAGDRNTGGEP